MKRILFIIPRMRFGGAEKVVSWLANNLEEEDIDVTVYSLQKVKPFYWLNDKVSYYTGPNTIISNNTVIRTIERLASFPKSFFSLACFLRKNRYDLILSFNYSADILVGIIRLFHPEIKYICSERNDPIQIPRLKLLLLLKIYKKAEFFVCQSQAVSDFYGNRLDNKVIIPNSIDLSSVPKAKKFTKEKLVSVGRLDTQKNYDMMIEAFSECVKEGMNAKLEIYGDGLKKEKLERKIIDMKMESHILLKGVSKNSLESINGAYLFVMSSLYEGFPNVFLEAMSVGVPVVTTDFSPGTARDIINENTGIVITKNTKKDLKEAIKKIYYRTDLRDSMSENCLELVKMYDTSKIYPKWKTIILSGLGE